jgi:triacylglycerol lipase
MTFLVQLPLDSYPDELPSDFGRDESFSFPAAQALMWLAQLSYEQDTTIDTILARWGLQKLVHLHSPTEGPGSNTATQGFVCRRNGTTIVAFAGTDPGIIKTVLTDVQTVPDDRGMHPGFRRALDAVWTQVRTAALLPDRGRLFVTGHSLGAALAVLAAFRLQREANISANAVYGFGLPRVGGTEFGTQYEPILGVRTFRLVNGDDPVPSLPPLSLGFHHVGRRLFCPHEGQFDPRSAPAATQDDQPTFAKIETNFALAIVRDLLTGRWPIPAQPGLLGRFYALLPGGVADHLPARYLRALGTPVR